MKKNFSYVKNELFKKGYCIVENYLNSTKCQKIIKEIESINNSNIKKQFVYKRNLERGQITIRDLVLIKPKSFLNLIDKKFILKVLSKVFDDRFILENIMASNSINVKNKYSAKIHCDSLLSTTNPRNSTDVVVMYCLDDFDKNNGATKVWPGSHLSDIRPHIDINNIKKKIKKFKYIKAKKGSIVFFLGQTWHQIGKNLNSKRRWSVIVHYRRWWMKPSTDFTKCGSAIYKKLNKTQKELFGFNSISPKFNFKNKSSKVKTLRKLNKFPKSYFQAQNY